MYSLLRNAPLRKHLAAEARTLLVSQSLTLLPALVITQLFYHWKSFLLEFVGFLATWFVIDVVVTTLRELWGKRAKVSDVN